MSGYTTVAAASMRDAAGNALNGTIFFQPCTAPGGVPTSFRGGGDATGQRAFTQVSATITNGAFSVPLCDVSMTAPVDVGYLVTVEDALTGNQLLGPGYIIQPTGTGVWSLDAFVPNLSPNVTIQNGPSAYDVAVANGFTGTVAQWLVSITGPMGQVSGPGMATAISKHDPINLVALASISYTAQIATQDGSVHIIPGDSRFYATDYFVVPPGGTLIANAGTVTAAGYPPFGYAFYDYNLNYIIGYSAAANTVVNVPANATYGRFSANVGDTPIAQLMVLGNTATMPSLYVFPGTTISASNAIHAAVSSGSGGSSYAFVTNLFDPTRLQYAVQITTGNGQPFGIANDSRFYATGYFPAPSGGTLVSNAATITAAGYPPFGYAFYDQMLNYVGGASAASGIVVSVPATAVYARFSAATTIGEPSIGAVMILPNTSALPTTYIYPGLPITASAAIDQSSVLSNATLPAYGKKWYHVGDSISAIYGGGWLPGVVANTGIVQVGQDAHTGRDTQAIFEYYGLNSAGSYTGPDPVNGIAQDPTSQGVQNVWADGNSRWTIAGKTLPQVLAAAAPDLITIYLGTNDENGAMGTVNDPPSANTECGFIKTAIEGYMRAYPSARLMWIAPYKTIYPLSNGTQLPIVTAIKAVCELYGVPVLDLDATSGVNPLTYSVYLRDGIHPGDGAGMAMLTRRVSAFINGLF